MPTWECIIYQWGITAWKHSLSFTAHSAGINMEDVLLGWQCVLFFFFRVPTTHEGKHCTENSQYLITKHILASNSILHLYIIKENAHNLGYTAQCMWREMQTIILDVLCFCSFFYSWTHCLSLSVLCIGRGPVSASSVLGNISFLHHAPCGLSQVNIAGKQCAVVLCFISILSSSLSGGRQQQGWWWDILIGQILTDYFWWQSYGG